MNIVGASLTPDEFAEYAAGVQFAQWLPGFVVLHNTANPTLAMRPQGFTYQHLLNLKSYYEGKTPPWTAGPHLFIDDRRIHVFSPLHRRGTHSRSWNATSWGVEMLGNYEYERFDIGRGALVRDNAVRAVAALYSKLGKSPDTLRFHKEDPHPKSDHDSCPGRNVDKADFIRRVKDAMVTALDRPYKLVVYKRGEGHEPYAVIPVQMQNGQAMADSDALSRVTGGQSPGGVRAVRSALEASGFSVVFRPEQRRIYAVEK